MRAEEEKKVKKKLSVLFITVMLVAASFTTAAQAAISNGASRGIKRIEVKESVPVKILADYRDKGWSGVIDAGVYTKVDDSKLIARENKKLDGHSNKKAALCSCCVKPVMMNGKKTLLFGRNMDLPNSYYPAYIFRIEEPGKYRTVNIGYVGELYPYETFDQIAETSAMAKEFHENLPYQVTDIMNEKGLVIETNMRFATPELACNGTNPGAKVRLGEGMLARYLGDRCANIEEALKLVNTLDVYTAKSPITCWSFAMVMMDATGRYGVLEFVKNRPVWTEGHPGQVNCWVDKEANRISGINCGVGRWNAMMKRYPQIKTMEDMRKNMQNIWYSQLFTQPAKNQSFDPATESVDLDVQKQIDMVLGWQKNYGVKVDTRELAAIQKIADEQKANKTVWTTAYVTSPKNKDKVYAVNDFITHAFVQLPVEGRKLSGVDECSDISYVVNNRDLVYEVQFFEQPQIFRVSFDGVK